MSFLKVTAHLSCAMAADPPHLDSLVECVLAAHQGLAHECDRSKPAPPVGCIAIPIRRKSIAGQSIACCSSPILSEVQHEGVEHFCKRLDVSLAESLHPQERRVIAMGNATYKAYRLPLRVRLVDRIVWFAEGDRKELLSVLRRVQGLGKKRSYGYSRVHEWTVERIDDDWSWFADGPMGRVLMRPLPVAAVPSDIAGAMREWAACQPPYWHPDRIMEVMKPC